MFSSNKNGFVTHRCLTIAAFSVDIITLDYLFNGTFNHSKAHLFPSLDCHQNCHQFVANTHTMSKSHGINKFEMVQNITWRVLAHAPFHTALFDLLLLLALLFFHNFKRSNEYDFNWMHIFQYFLLLLLLRGIKGIQWTFLEVELNEKNRAIKKHFCYVRRKPVSLKKKKKRKTHSPIQVGNICNSHQPHTFCCM